MQYEKRSKIKNLMKILVGKLVFYSTWSGYLVFFADEDSFCGGIQFILVSSNAKWSLACLERCSSITFGDTDIRCCPFQYLINPML